MATQPPGASTRGDVRYELDGTGLVSSGGALQRPDGAPILLSAPLDLDEHPSGRIYVANWGNAQSDPSDGA